MLVLLPSGGNILFASGFQTHAKLQKVMLSQRLSASSCCSVVHVCCGLSPVPLGDLARKAVGPVPVLRWILQQVWLCCCCAASGLGTRTPPLAKGISGVCSDHRCKTALLSLQADLDSVSTSQCLRLGDNCVLAKLCGYAVCGSLPGGDNGSRWHAGSLPSSRDKFMAVLS